MRMSSTFYASLNRHISNSLKLISFTSCTAHASNLVCPPNLAGALLFEYKLKNINRNKLKWINHNTSHTHTQSLDLGFTIYFLEDNLSCSLSPKKGFWIIHLFLPSMS